ncbi:GNAT family N-acetyltransferase [Methanocella conradii]|uniref:GNAT family N-acetyltransferase n=1 Tax=Methanocella conradii TaxID=1175444 RepID=UPI0024B3A782|nr:GNAT family N-acetyltransferase [Methanocella conradii]MDI6896448.1 GNAT family N-acetyltransferase [Methanocella conradii]
MSWDKDGRHSGLEVARGAAEDIRDVFADAARCAPPEDSAYISYLLDMAIRGDIGVYSLSARCHTIGAICYRMLDGDAELAFGHVIWGDTEPYFLESVVKDLFNSGAHTVRSNFNWPAPWSFIRGAEAMGFKMVERMSMCLAPMPVKPSVSGFEILPWDDRHAGDVCRIISECQAPADRPVYPALSRTEDAVALVESVMRDEHGKFMRSLSYVAVVGRVIGFLISTMVSDGSILILDTGVERGHRRKGVGGAMLDRLIGDAYAAGYGRIILAVTSNNYDAIRLYRRKGFRVSGHYKHYVISKIG